MDEKLEMFCKCYKEATSNEKLRNIDDYIDSLSESRIDHNTEPDDCLADDDFEPQPEYEFDDSVSKPLAMISQGMNGKTDEEILSFRVKAIEKLENLGFEVINTFFNDTEAMKDEMESKGVKTEPVYYLSKSIEQMSKVSVVYFANDWFDYRGCRIEHDIATSYGIAIMTELD